MVPASQLPWPWPYAGICTLLLVAVGCVAIVVLYCYKYYTFSCCCRLPADRLQITAPCEARPYTFDKAFYNFYVLLAVSKQENKKEMMVSVTPVIVISNLFII